MIVSLQIDLNDFIKNKNLLQIGLNGKVDELKQIQSLADGYNQESKKQETIFKYQNAIQVLDQALQLIGQLRDDSFIQNRNVLFLQEGFKQLYMYHYTPSFNDQLKLKGQFKI